MDTLPVSKLKVKIHYQRRKAMSHSSFSLTWKLGSRDERERLFGSREREEKLKITFPFTGRERE